MNACAADGFFLHASSVVIDGGALLFLGHSSAGKTTLSQLLEKKYPVLADDLVFASITPHGWQVVDGGYRAEDGSIFGWEQCVRRRFALGPAIPLLGCVRIHKAQHVKTLRLDPIETARCLVDAVNEVVLQGKFRLFQDNASDEKEAAALIRRMRMQWFQKASKIARAIPGWRLWFSRNSHFPDLFEAVSMMATQARRHSGAS